jgi:hypothetical protein
MNIILYDIKVYNILSDIRYNITTPSKKHTVEASAKKFVLISHRLDYEVCLHTRVSNFIQTSIPNVYNI